MNDNDLVLAPSFAALCHEPVTQKHVDYCADNGHSEYSGPDDSFISRCPRCGSGYDIAVNFLLPYETVTMPATDELSVVREYLTHPGRTVGHWKWVIVGSRNERSTVPSLSDTFDTKRAAVACIYNYLEDLQKSDRVIDMNTTTRPAAPIHTEGIDMTTTELPTVQTATGHVVVYPKNCDACNKRINKVNRSEDVTRCKTCFNITAGEAFGTTTPNDTDEWAADMIAAENDLATTTTKTKSSAPTCLSCNVKLTKRNSDSQVSDDNCKKCFEIGGIENDHMDGHHDDVPTKKCPMCVADVGDDTPAPAKKTKPAKVTESRSWNSHATCKHESSPAARRVCRTLRAALDNPAASTAGAAKKAPKKSKTTKRTTAVSVVRNR